MASNGSKNPKKANLLDHHSIKHILDESVSEVTLILYIYVYVIAHV